MLAAEQGNNNILALLAQHNADMRLQDAEGKGEKKQGRVEMGGGGHIIEL